MKTGALSQIYGEIASCHICPNMDTEKAKRKIESVDIESDVFIVSQAVAAKQLRKTGVNFFQDTGKLGSTGRNLETFLNKFTRTLYPPWEVALNSDLTISARLPQYRSAYTTDITHCYPGRNRRKKGDRAPIPAEMRACLEQRYLLREIELLRPRLILLMGKQSRNAFFQYMLHLDFPRSLRNHISSVIEAGIIPSYTLDTLDVHLLPIQHASGLNPLFLSMATNDRLVDMIKEILE